MMVPDDDPGDDEFEGEEKENAGPQDLHTEMPHRNAVESQGAKKASLGRKSGMWNWIDIAA